MKAQQGQILVLALIVVGVVLINTLVIVSGSQLFSQNTNYNVQVTQAVNLAEAGMDKAVASLNASGGAYSGDSEVSLGAGSFSVSITTPNPNTKIIESTGFVPSKTNPKLKRTVKVSASKGIGVAFSYSVQVGEGGLEMSNNSRVNGSIYSNGNIVMSNNAQISGDAYVAGGVAAVADQENSCSPPSCIDFIFGKNVNGEDRLDIAQSFMPSTSSILNKVVVKLKKIGSPPDILVRLLKDKSGQPDKNNVLATGSLPANLVTSQYSLVEVTFSSPPQLLSDTPYWIMLDTSTNSANFWSWSADSMQGYSRGQALWSPNWKASSPSWYTPTSPGIDLDFQTYMGGSPTSIQGTYGDSIGGDAHANTLKSLTVGKGAYYQVMESVTAGSYYPNSPDPSPKVMPISDGNISTWKQQAEESGIYIGDISSCRATLPSGKYIGNVTFTNNCIITVTDPIWIIGTLNLSNGVNLKLDSSYGASSGVIIVDDIITLSNNVKLKGSGITGSFLMVLSTVDNRSGGSEAITVANGGNEGILYAPYGAVEVSNNNRLNELTAWKVELGNDVVIDYDSGLASTFFSLGPTGAYSLVKGTYQLK